MKAQIVNGNEALALGALRAGVKVVTGYPGTPSSRALASLLAMDLQDRHVEWSTNEKVALEIATGAAWAGQRALCTMKMSGLNVAYDSLISIAYSGTVGGLVIYVADDPGVTAGMAEQDSRGFSLMSDLPMLEPASVAETYVLIQQAFELSEKTGTPVFIRLVTAIANSKTAIEIEDIGQPLERQPVLIRDINRFTKAGAAICMAQHRDLIGRLEKSGELVREMHINHLELASEPGHLGIIASGVSSAYIAEGLDLLAGLGLDPSQLSILRVSAFNPFPDVEVDRILKHCNPILVLEELEPYLEKSVYTAAYRLGLQPRIIGKIDGTFSRIGEYGIRQVAQGVAKALDLAVPEAIFQGIVSDPFAAARPITVCAGCPHRGTFMAINQALRKLRFKKDEVMVTGDIGCTILGMNPPFNTVWNEISMGASISLAQGFVHGGVKTPVIATIGDSTFFHAGIPGLINAIQHQVPLTLVIMDNGWTAMTGMQVNAGTAHCFQNSESQSVDIARIVPALGIDQFFSMDPFDLPSSVRTLQQAINLPGVKVVLSRRECAIQTNRRAEKQGTAVVDLEKCAVCKLCITLTGCPALSIEEGTFMINEALCNGCGLCLATCNLDALTLRPVTSQVN
jgi:indolepyruvate ferredoxin oxidoreductase, alpha subunit